MDVAFETRFDPRHGEAVAVAPGIVRITAPNAGPFTFHGTNTYLVGERSLALVDPGPDDDRHLAALLSAIGGRTVDAVLLTHTHRDHSALTRRLTAATGGPPVIAEGPHRPSRAPRPGEAGALDAASDGDLVPDEKVGDGAWIELPAARLQAVATPGHTANHMAFSVEGTGALLTGDHVMGWSTTVVAPPDGSMADYMASIDRLLGRDDTLFLPGHGGAVTAPRRHLRALRAHRQMREGAILERLRGGDRTIGAIVAALYRQIDPRLHGAAGLSVLAHLEDLRARGVVEAEDGPAPIDGLYRLS